MIPLGVLAGSRHASAPSGGVTAAYQGTATTTSTEQTSTFAAMPIGTPTATRTVIVGLIWRGSSTSAAYSLTVGGITATRDQFARSGWQHIEFYRAEIPTGSTADVTVAFSSAPQQGVIVATWALDAHVAVVDAEAATAAPLSVTVDTASGGIAIGLVGYATNGPAAWTGPSERFDLTNMTTRGSGADMPTGGTPATVAATLTGAVVDQALSVVTYQGV